MGLNWPAKCHSPIISSHHLTFAIQKRHKNHNFQAKSAGMIVFAIASTVDGGALGKNGSIDSGLMRDDHSRIAMGTLRSTSSWRLASFHLHLSLFLSECHHQGYSRATAEYSKFTLSFPFSFHSPVFPFFIPQKCVWEQNRGHDGSPCEGQDILNYWTSQTDHLPLHHTMIIHISNIKHTHTKTYLYTTQA